MVSVLFIGPRANKKNGHHLFLKTGNTTIEKEKRERKEDAARFSLTQNRAASSFLAFSVWAHNAYDVREAAADRHAEFSRDLNRINEALSRLGARALREAGISTYNGWKSEALFRQYAQAVENRLRMAASPYTLLAEPAAMPFTQERVPIRPNPSEPVNPFDGFPKAWSQDGSR